jgi:PAS domain-containing protein
MPGGSVSHRGPHGPLFHRCCWLWWRCRAERMRSYAPQGGRRRPPLHRPCWHRQTPRLLKQNPRSADDCSGMRLSNTEMPMTNELVPEARLILDAIAKGVCGIDREGTVVFCNEAVLELSGFSREEIVGKNVHDVLHPCQADGMKPPREECKLSETFRDKRMADRLRSSTAGVRCGNLAEILDRRDIPGDSEGSSSPKRGAVPAHPGEHAGCSLDLGLGWQDALRKPQSRGAVRLHE